MNLSPKTQETLKDWQSRKSWPTVRKHLLRKAEEEMIQRKARRIARKKLGLPPEEPQADEQSTPETDG